MSGDTIKLRGGMVEDKLPKQRCAENRTGHLVFCVEIAKALPLSVGRVLSVSVREGAS